MNDLNRLLRHILLAMLAVIIAAASLAAKSKVEWQTYSVAQLKAAMSTLGTGEHARVIVTLTGGTKLNGYVSQLNDTVFVVVANGEETRVEYDEVSDIRAGNPDTQVKFAARIGTEAAAIAAQTPVPPQPHPKRQALSTTAKAVVVIAITAAGIVASLAALGKL